MQPLDQEKDYFESNKDLWNRKTELHIDSEFYDNKTFLEGRNSLNQRPEDSIHNVALMSPL